MKQISNFKKAIPYILATLIGLAMTPTLINMAYQWRGYMAIGGEVLVIPVALLIVLFVDVVRSERKENNHE